MNFENVNFRFTTLFYFTTFYHKLKSKLVKSEEVVFPDRGDFLTGGDSFRRG